MKKLQTEILKILSDDSRTDNAKIATMLGVSEKEVIAEVDSMIESGIIAKFTAIINEEKLDFERVEALIEVKVMPMYSKGFDSIAEDIYQFDEVKSLYLMSGSYDLAVFIEGNTLKEVARFVSEKLSVMDKVLSTATHFILKKYKRDGVVLGEMDMNKRISVHP